MADINYGVEPDENDSLVLVSAESWCAPCKAFAPVFSRAAADYDGDTKLYKLDLDSHGELVSKYEVMSVPTVLRIKDGAVTKIDERRPKAFVEYVKSL